MSEQKISVTQTEGVDWEFEIENGSNKVTAMGTYTDDYEDWMARAPNGGSPHPDFPALRLKKLKGKRTPGLMIEVTLNYEAFSAEFTFPGREAGKIKRYGIDPSTTEEPLLTNHLFKDLSDAEKEALQELMTSSKSDDDFTKASEKVKSEAGLKALGKIRLGIEAYLNPGLVWVERFTTKNLDDLELDKILTTTDSPPGNIPSTEDERNWLYLAGPASPLEDGEHWDIEKRWQLSEKGKWDPDLYPSS